jgi:hypothetical protein
MPDIVKFTFWDFGCFYMPINIFELYITWKPLDPSKYLACMILEATAEQG